MGTRQEVRSELAALFSLESEFNRVFAYAPLDLIGTNNALIIYAKWESHEFISAHLNNHFYAFTLDFLAKRDNSELAENSTDAAAEAIKRVIRAHISDPFWSSIQLETDSEAYFAEVSGVPYRGERHTVIVKVSD